MIDDTWCLWTQPWTDIYLCTLPFHNKDTGMHGLEYSRQRPENEMCPWGEANVYRILNGTTSNIIIHRSGYQRLGRIIIVIKTITNHPPTQQWHSGMHNNSRKHTHTRDKTTGTSKSVCLLSTHLNCKRSEIKLWIPAPPTKRGGFEFPTPPTRRDGFEFPEPTYLFKILSRAWLRGSKIAPFNIEAWKIRVITVQSSLMITIRVATCMRTSTL